MSYREEKMKEKKEGRKSALDKREEEAEAHQVRKQQRESGKGGGPTSWDRGSLRAGAMWRLMEAGKIFKQGADAEPENEEAQRLAKAAKHLTHLDAFKVLNTEQVMHYGECHRFFGQELDGSLCDKKRYKFE